MVEFRLSDLPRALKLKTVPTVRVEGDAIFVSLDVFSVENPENEAQFEICLAKEYARQLVARLGAAVQKII